jgi:hypothetical protein
MSETSKAKSMRGTNEQSEGSSASEPQAEAQLSEHQLEGLSGGGISPLDPRTREAQISAFPDVCLTPTPGGPVPIPYPTIGTTSPDGTSAPRFQATKKGT